ncbi:hypothetical protein D3C74_451510 [compost metagenome]
MCPYTHRIDMVADFLHIVLRFVKQQSFQHHIHICFGEHGDVLSNFVIDTGMNIIIIRECLSGRKVK